MIVKPAFKFVNKNVTSAFTVKLYCLFIGCFMPFHNVNCSLSTVLNLNFMSFAVGLKGPVNILQYLKVQLK